MTTFTTSSTLPLNAVPLSPRSLPPLASIPFYGRSLLEYIDGFALDLSALKRQAILDVGSGPSSFAVDAARRGLDVAAIDPLYGCSVDTLATHIQLDYARVAVDACKRLKGEKLNQREALEAERRIAAQRFLADYESGFLHNRYIGGALSRLPFLDRSFDLVLCGQLLFGPYSSFNDEQILQACCELVRVSTGEVRVSALEGLSPVKKDAMPGQLAAVGILGQFSACLDSHGKSASQGLLVLKRLPR